MYWLDVLQEAGLVGKDDIAALHAETNELISIFVSIVKKVKSASRDAA